MEDRKTKSRKKTALRRRAEKQLQGQGEALVDLTPEQIRRLVHELRVHQVELEMQKEELRQTQVSLEESRARYSDLYDFAPISYFTLDETGKILEANLTAASLLGEERDNLIGKMFLQFVVREDTGGFTRFLPQVLESRSRQSCEVRLKGRFGELVARLDGILWQDAGGRTSCRVTATDISNMRAVEAEIRRLASFPQLNVNPVLEVDAGGAITFCNQAGLNIVHCGGCGPEAFLPGDLKEIQAAARERPAEVFSREVRIKDAVFAEDIAYVEALDVFRIYANDITPRYRFESALRAANAQLSALIDNSPLAILRLDEDGTILSCNPAAERMLGWSAAELVGQRLPMVPPEEKGIVREVLQRVAQGERFTGIERRRLRQDGSLVEVSVSVAPIYDEAGTYTGIVSLMEDITPRKAAEAALRQARDELEERVRERTADLRRTVETLQLEVGERLLAEERLKQSEARFRSAFDQSPVGAVIVDHNLGIQRVNPAFCRIIGYDAGELATMNVADVAHPDDMDRNREGAKGLLAGDLNVFRTEERGIRKDGTVIWIDLSVSVINPGDNPLYFLGIVQDITTRKVAEKDLAHHAALVRDLYDNAPCGYHSLDPEGRFVQVNSTELDWLGYTREEMLGGMHLTDLLTPASREIFLKSFPVFKERGWVSDLEYELVRRDGTILPVLLNATAVRDEAGHYMMSRSTIIDITERRRAQEALEAERRRFFGMLEKIPAYVSLIGPDCTIPYANREFIRRFGDPEGRLCHEFLFGIDSPCEGCKTLEVFKTNTPVVWEWQGPDGNTYQIHDHPFTDVDGSPLVLEMGVDITELKAAQAGILRQAAILSGINRVFRETLTCTTEEELGRTCLAVVEELTGSPFGFLGEVNPAGSLTIAAFSDPGWAACRMGEDGQQRVKLLNLEMRGLIGEVIKNGRTVVANDPPAHPSAVGLPPGHPPVSSYLGVPLEQGGKAMGLIALANKAGGYTQADQDAVESLSAAIVEGLGRFRAEARVVIVSRLYLFLSKVNEAIVRVRDQATLFQEICRIAVMEGGFKMAWVGMVDSQGDAIKAVTQYGLEDGYLGRITISFRQGPESLGPTGTAVREDRFDICNDIANDSRMAPWREEALRRGYRSSGAFPLRIDGKAVGSLTMYAGRPGFFTGEEVRLLESLAQDVSFAMESLKREALRRRAEVALQESEVRLRALAAQLIDSQETERNRIALELHDDLGQSLMVLTMQLRAISKMLPEDQSKPRDSFNQVVAYVSEIIENVRRLARDLRPSLLEDLGLPAALKHLAETFQSYHGISVALDMDDIKGLFIPQEEINIYRIFQESLTNIAKHAQATQVSCTIRRWDGRVSFKVEDNGRGFDMEHILDKDAPRKGLGLVAMAERVRIMGGELEIWSQAGKGTRISFILPIRT